jgi:hypothetical protein
MARSGVFYAVKAMQRVAAGAAADGVAGGPARGAVARRKGSIVSLRRRVLAAMHLATGGARGRARHRSRKLGGAAQVD